MHNNDSDIIRVLHMIGSFEIGGSQMMVLNLYKAINREKIQFDFILDHAEAVALVPEVKALGARIYILPQFKGHNFFEVCKAWDDFFVKHPEYRILHSHVRSYASLYIPIAQRHGLKTIIHSHNTSNGKGVVSGIKKIMQYPLRYQADYFFACSEEAGKWLFGKQVLKTDCFRIISNGIDCERFRFNKLYRDSIRKEVGITNNFVIGHVGRHTTQKNPLFLIEVFAEIYRKDRNVRLLQVGQGEMTDQIKKKCQKLGIEDVVIFVGARKDIEKYYSAMDIFLFPRMNGYHLKIR